MHIYGHTENNVIDINVAPGAVEGGDAGRGGQWAGQICGDGVHGGAAGSRTPGCKAAGGA